MTNTNENKDLTEAEILSKSDLSVLLGTRLNIPSIGAGTLRTAATWIAVMLMAESDAINVISEVMKELDITPEQITDEYYDEACPHCGCSLLAHRENNGKCS